jgi:ubiquinone/menaquinone biosynthesis C-methylase UbiE
MALDNRHYYDEFAASYERHRHHGYHEFIDELETSLVRRYLRSDMQILEAGCGTGLLLNRLRQHTARAVGVDLSRGMLKKARDRDLEVVQGSVTALPFSDALFDLVYSFKVLAHVEAIEQALAEMTRVLRPGGLLCAEFYNARSLRYLIKRWKPPTPIATSAAAEKPLNDEAIYTRYDTLPRIRGYLPPSLRVQAVHGIRVITPLSVLHRVPVVAPMLQSLERFAADLPVLQEFGGFLLVVARKEL